MSTTEHNRQIRDLVSRFIAKEELYVSQLGLIESVYLIEIPSLKVIDDQLRNALNLLQEIATAHRQFSKFLPSVKDLTSNPACQVPKTVQTESEIQLLNDLFECKGLVETYNKYMEIYMIIKYKIYYIVSTPEIESDYKRCVGKAKISLDKMILLPIEHLNFYLDIFSDFINGNKIKSEFTSKMKIFVDKVGILLNLSKRLSNDENEHRNNLWSEFNQLDLIIENPERILIDRINVGKYGKNKIKKLHMVLFNDSILFGLPFNGYYKECGFLELQWCEISVYPQTYIPRAISISSPMKNYIIQFETDEVRNEFFDKIIKTKNNALLTQQIDYQQFGDCNNIYCNIKTNISKQDLKMCHICSKQYCSNCLIYYDLINGCKLKIKEHSYIDYENNEIGMIKFSVFCRLCYETYMNNARQCHHVHIRDNSIPCYWETLNNNNNEILFQNEITHSTTGLHPDFIFQLEDINKNEHIDCKYRRDYTTNGDKFYTNLTNNQVQWEVPLPKM